MKAIAPYAKAAVAFALAGLTTLGAALADGHVTSVEWVAVAIAALGTTAGVYYVPNTPAE